MLLAASVYTARMQKLISRWKLEGGLPPVAGQKVASLTAETAAPVEVPLCWKKEDLKILPNEDLGPTITGDPDFGGTYVVYDWEAREIIWQAKWGSMLVTPAGHCFADGHLYICDLEAGNIFQVDVDEHPGKLLKRISHPYLNDIHSLERTKRGLLITCSGTDMIIELDLDGNLLWEWWATEHGYSMTPSGKERTSGRGQEHRDTYYHTRYQTTHLNCANIQDPKDERFVLCLLFHQGQLIRIDRSLPSAQQHATVMLEGLARPHSLEKIPGGWIFCNSLSKELVLIDDDLKITSTIPYDGGWIQDCTRLPSGRILLNDVDQHVLVEFAGPPWEIVQTTPYNQDWRMGELVVVPAQHEHASRKPPRFPSRRSQMRDSEQAWPIGSSLGAQDTAQQESVQNISTGGTLWLTGMSGSGKSTISHLLQERLRAIGARVEILDGDIVRTRLCKGLGYSREDRDENVRRIGFICEMLSRNGVIAIAAAISPYRASREEVRARIPNFFEIYMKCPVELLIERDVKGLYKKALAGEIPQFTGISDPYEPPLQPEIVIDSSCEKPDESIEKIWRKLQQVGFLSGEVAVAPRSA